MAFTRKALEAMGIEAGKIDQIMELHVEVVDALKHERDTMKAAADKAAGIQEEYTKLKQQAAGDFENKYNQEHAAFEAYKQQIADEAVLTEKRGLYTEMLKKIGIDEARIPAVLKVTDFTAMELKDHALTKAADIEAAAKQEWAGFISTERRQGADVEHGGEGKTGREAFNAMTLSERMAFANAHPGEAAEYMK